MSTAARARLARDRGGPAGCAGKRSLRCARALRRGARLAQAGCMVGVAVAAMASVVLVVTGGAQDFLSLFQPTQLAPSR